MRSANRPSFVRRWLKRLIQFSLALLLVGLLVATTVYLYYSRDLPGVEELKTKRPPLSTKVLCQDGKVCAEFFVERRTWVDIRSLPKHVASAFLAAEDADFYQHHGLDYFGILRATIKNLIPGSLKSGASTISQQTCRALLLSSERTASRKFRELILTPRMESALTKDEILNLYVNTIYFGHQRYGIEEAALFYFGKHASELTVGEAAVLAGTVQLPYRINPLTSIVKAKRRQRYVLNQMWQKGFVSQESAEKEIEAPIVLGPRNQPAVGQYYAEEVRKQLVARFGAAQVEQGGLRVTVAMNPQLQAAAEQSVRLGLEAVDKRQGYRGPIGTLAKATFTAIKPLIVQRLTEAGKRRPDELLVADLTALKDANPKEDGATGTAFADESVDDDPPTSEQEKLARAVGIRPLNEGTETVGWVSQVDDAKQLAVIDVVGKEAVITFSTITWARRKTAAGLAGAPAKMSDVLAENDLVRIRLGKAIPASVRVEATLVQTPLVQGALLAINPLTRHVVAMVGGYDFSLSAFNRSVQAKRQPGSAFKPFLYGAALATKQYTPISIVNDSPEAIVDPWTGKAWKPQNYEKGGFDGPITLRQALTRSKNTVSVKLITALTPVPIITFAKAAGIQSELPENLTLALGTGEVTLIELTNAYATLQSEGQFSEAIVLVSVANAQGTILEEHQAAFETRVEAPVAHVTTSLMRSVVEEGTAMQVLELQRPAAGKTGTAQESRDAWFVGFTKDYVTGAWVGFDDHSPIGAQETGGKAALPLWLRFMKAAHVGLPVREFEVPDGVTQVRIDGQTQKLAGKSVPGRMETFVSGTEPTSETPEPGSVDPADYMLKDLHP